MSQKRPSTLKYLKILVDVYEILKSQPRNTVSRTELSAILHEKYKLENPVALNRYFDGDPGLEKGTFPSPSTVGRYLDEGQDDLLPYLGRKLIPQSEIKKGQIAYGGPGLDSKELQALMAVANALFRSLDAIVPIGAKRDIRLALSESVNYFLLPKLTSKLTEKYLLEPNPISTETIVKIRTGDLDGAISWECQIREEKNNNDSGPDTYMKDITEVKILSDCRLCLICHPSYLKRFNVSQLKRNPETKALIFDAEFFKRLRKETEKPILIFPTIPTSKKLALKFKEEEYAEILGLEHFSTVMRSVIAGAGMGLFFELPSILTELEHDHMIVSAELDLSDPVFQDLDKVLNLKGYLRAKPHEIDTLDETRTQAQNLMTNLAKKIAEEKKVSKWQYQHQQTIAPENFENKRWYCHFVTLPKEGDFLLPYWRQGMIQFSAELNNGCPQGQLYTYTDAPMMDLLVEPEPLKKGCLMVRFSRAEEKDGQLLSSFTVAYAPTMLKNGDRSCYLGNLSFGLGASSYTSPIVFSESSLSIEDCLEIAQCRRLDFINGINLVRYKRFDGKVFDLSDPQQLVDGSS